MERPTLFHTAARLVPEDAFILVRNNKTNFKIFLKDILYIEAYGEYMKIHTPEKVHLSRETMHELEEKLPHVHFLRVHKSFIVPVQKITAFSTYSVYIQKQEIPIGRSYKETVYNVLAGLS